MMCSICNTVLSTINIKSTNIDICSKCYGIWLDKNEILELMENIEETYENLSKLMEIDSKQTEQKKDEKLWQDEIECPRCHQLMQKFAYAGSSDIIIDSCRNGCGIWLDKGEIFKIADYLSKTQQPLDTKQQQNIKQILSTLEKKKVLNIWELLGKRYNNDEDLTTDLKSSPDGKYIAMILAILQGIAYFLLSKK